MVEVDPVGITTSSVYRDRGTIRNSGGLRVTWRRFVPSTTTLVIIVMFVVAMMMNGSMTPWIRRGFYCSDVSIKYPHLDDTVNFMTLFFVALVIPGLMIKFCDETLKRLLNDPVYWKRLGLFTSERKRKISNEIQTTNSKDNPRTSSNKVKKRNLRDHKYEALKTESDNDEPSEEVNLDCHEVELSKDDEDKENYHDSDTNLTASTSASLSRNNPELNNKRTKMVARLMSCTFSEFQLFFFGFTTTMIFSGLGKLTAGRLRPHFIQRCQPNINCLDPKYVNKYIQKFKCTNSKLKDRDLSYITTSWPSGHAAIIFYSMIYSVIFLNSVIPMIMRLRSQKYRKRSVSLVFPLLNMSMIALAIYISLTRVSDYHHHPTDVASGSIMGATIAIVISNTLTLRYLKHVKAIIVDPRGR